MPKEDNLAQFKNKVRVRVCGILEKNNEILVIRHRGLDDKDTWLTPGGGVNFGESIEKTLEREFKEETGLNISVSNFMCIKEYINNGFHAIELYYRVNYVNGTLKLGFDPELSNKNQIMKEIKYSQKKVVSKYLDISL